MTAARRRRLRHRLHARFVDDVTAAGAAIVFAVAMLRAWRTQLHEARQ